MKRTLAIWLWMSLGAGAFAQNPAVVQKNVQTAVKAGASTQAAVSAKPSTSTVKVVAVTAPKQAAVAAKPVTVAVKPSAVQSKPTAAVHMTPTVKPVAVAVPAAKGQVSVPSAHEAVVAKSAQTSGTTKAAPVAVKVATPKSAELTKADPFKSGKTNAHATPATKADSTKVVAVKDKASEQKKPLAAAVVKRAGQAGRRDPFISPVVTMSAVGSGCSSGKRCLAIDQIALRGVVRSDNGMIAVVVNAAAKAYFLRENDPVFNGYVVKITGDSIVFKETFHDKLGKPLTRDITKTISRPVA